MVSNLQYLTLPRELCPTPTRLSCETLNVSAIVSLICPSIAKDRRFIQLQARLHRDQNIIGMSHLDVILVQLPFLNLTLLRGHGAAGFMCIINVHFL